MRIGEGEEVAMIMMMIMKMIMMMMMATTMMMMVVMMMLKRPVYWRSRGDISAGGWVPGGCQDSEA